MSAAQRRGTLRSYTFGHVAFPLRAAARNLPRMIQTKSFYRSLEKVFAGAGRVKQRERFAQRIAPALLDVLREPLGVTSVHLYERRKDGFSPPKTWGAKRADIGADLALRFASTGDDRIAELPWAGDVGTDDPSAGDDET